MTISIDLDILEKLYTGEWTGDLNSVLFLQDSFYINPLEVPETGLELRTRIYVEVRAVNLTGK